MVVAGAELTLAAQPVLLVPADEDLQATQNVTQLAEQGHPAQGQLRRLSFQQIPVAGEPQALSMRSGVSFELPTPLTP